MYSMYVNWSADGADFKDSSRLLGANRLAGAQFGTGSLSLAEKGAVACIVLSGHGGFCSGRRSKERQPCQHNSSKHAEFISAARRGAQINKYKSQTHCSGWSSAGGVVVCYCSKKAGLAKLRPFNVEELAERCSGLVHVNPADSLNPAIRFLQHLSKIPTD